MYPSNNYPSYGVFVKNIKEMMISFGVEFVGQAVIKGRTENNIIRIYNYINLYFSFVYHVLLNKHNLIYLHYFSFYSIPIIFLSAFSKKKVIVNIHGTDLLASGSLTRQLQHIAVSKCDLFILPSAYFMKKFMEIFPKVDKRNIIIYASGGVNQNVFYKKDKEPIIKQYGLEKQFTIGYVSHINNNKGWKEFLQSIEEFKARVCKDILIIIVGTGKNECDFDSFVTDSMLKPDIKRYCKLTQEKVSDLFSVMDIFVFPTKCEESLGLVGLEAMACGTPVIGSNAGALPSYIEDNYNGFIVKPGSSEDIYLKLRYFYNLTDENKIRLSAGASATADKYEVSYITTIFIDELINRFNND